MSGTWKAGNLPSRIVISLGKNKADNHRMVQKPVLQFYTILNTHHFQQPKDTDMPRIVVPQDNHNPDGVRYLNPKKTQNHSAGYSFF